MNGTRAIVPSLVAAFVLAACSSVRHGEAYDQPTSLVNGEVAHGAEVFARRCNKCHPNGEAGIGPGLHDKPLPSFLVHMQVRAGLGSMPSFDARLVNGPELRDLLTYLTAVRKQSRT